MSNNVLQQIIDKKKLKLEKLKNEISLENINDQIEKNDNFIDFKNKIQNNKYIFLEKIFESCHTNVHLLQPKFFYFFS